MSRMVKWGEGWRPFGASFFGSPFETGLRSSSG